MSVRTLVRTALLVFWLLIAIATPAAKAQPSDDLDALNQQVAALYQSGKYGEAMELSKRALALAESRFGRDHRNVSIRLNDLALMLKAQGRYAEAEPLLKRSLAIIDKSPDPDDPGVGAVLNNLAELYSDQGRYAEAEPLSKRALGIAEKAFGPDDPEVGIRLNNLAGRYQDQGRYSEAEPLYKRALAITEKALGPTHPNVGVCLNNLALLYAEEGRSAEAEPLMRRALEIDERARGPDHMAVGIRLDNLAGLFGRQGRYSEAEPLFTRALAITEKALGPNHPNVGVRLNNLAQLFAQQGRDSEAEPLLKRALAITETALGSDHPNLESPLASLAALYRRQGRYTDAEPLSARAFAIAEKAFGPDHPEAGFRLNDLATLHFEQGDWERAAHFWRRSTGVIIRRAQRGVLVGEAPTGKSDSEATRSGSEFWGLVKAAYRVASTQHDETRSLREMFQMFQVAQWAQTSKAAESVAQMAARGAKGNPELAISVRERQDLVVEWQRRDQLRTAAAGQPQGSPNWEGAKENIARLGAIEARIATIDKTLATNFPDYATLASPVPEPVEEVQAALAPDEALVMLLDTTEWKPTPEETFIWVVTRTDVRWVRSELGTRALTQEVAALRCGLDYAGSWASDEARCPSLLTPSLLTPSLLKPSLLKVAYTASDHSRGEPLPFDLARAHELYKALFGQIEAALKDKHHLLIVPPPGALMQLPFHVLVAEAPKAALAGSVIDYRDVAWLARKYAITMLPAVSSLKALRQLSKESHASEPFVGFGNPLLDGEPEKFREDQAAARLAREKRCEQTLRQRVASVLGLRGGTRTVTRSNSSVADVADLRSWAPLPETADELCDVARDLRVDPATHLYLGAMATEAKIKQLSADGLLARYKIIHFATHGAVSGQVSRLSEPGLLLTPPEKASEADDGYLSASEIATLKLDADWVILSACNTAAGSTQNAEAFSGLARAFFYAGARSLLVSHWEVASDATVKLITTAVAELRAHPKIGRAEALRRAMLSMITKGRDYEAHPAFWAPFVLVGEGGAAR